MSDERTTQIKEALACNLAEMNQDQRKRYEELKKRLRSATKEVKELPDGYAFRYEGNHDLVLAAAEFTTLEGRCCSFYTFDLEVAGNKGPMWLRITGPKEAKSFIRDAIAR